MNDEGNNGDENGRTSDVVERALLDLWSVASRLAELFPSDDRYRVTIFGSARVGPEHPVYRDVRRLATRLSELGCDIITGGGPGLMQAANEGSQIGDPQDQTRSVGIRVALPFEQGANPFVEKVYTHQTFFSRLHHFVRVTDAYVVMPGGLGTSLELVMVWQLLQVRHLREVPLVLVGPMWRELVEWARHHMVEVTPGFAGSEDVELPCCVDSVDEAAEIIEAHFRATKLAGSGSR
jgi:uncharacterized protein (TIGR00730 family)